MSSQLYDHIGHLINIDQYQYQPKKKGVAMLDLQLVFKKGVYEVDGKEWPGKYCQFCL